MPFLGYNKNWKNNFKIPGYVVKITLYNLTNEESFAILVLDHKNESVRIESKKSKIYNSDRKEWVEKVFKTELKLSRATDGVNLDFFLLLNKGDITNECKDESIMEQCVELESVLQRLLQRNSLTAISRLSYPSIDSIRENCVQLLEAETIIPKDIISDDCILQLGHNGNATVPPKKEAFHRLLANKERPLPWRKVEKYENFQVIPPYRRYYQNNHPKKRKAYFGKNRKGEIPSPHISSHDGIDRPYFHYSLYSFPMDFLQEIVDCTNANSTKV